MTQRKHKEYAVVRAGQWVQPVRRGYLMACCDCNLVHRMNFRIRVGRVQFQAFRDSNETRRLRRKGKRT